MSILSESNQTINTTFDQQYVYAPKRITVKPTISSQRDSRHRWKLILHKQDGSKVIKYMTTKKHALAIGQKIHNSSNRPTKMFSIEKV
jgi:hypothetical protein